MPPTSRKSHARQPATSFRLKVRRIGNDIGIMLPANLLEAADLRVGDTLEVEWQSDAGTLSMVKRPRLTLEQLIAEHASVQNRFEDAKEWEQAPPAGREII